MTLLSPVFDAVRRVEPLRITGRVVAVRGLTVLVDDLPLPIGSLVRFGAGRTPRFDERGGVLHGEIVGFSREHSVVMLLGQTCGVTPGDAVVGDEVAQTAPVGWRMLGRCIDGLGRPLDELGPIHDRIHAPLSPEPIPAMRRCRIDRQLVTGVKALDLMTPVGRGQRLGIFAGPGVGKSTLLGTIARRTAADVSVIALIGERGREVKDFIDHSLGPEGLARSVVVVATGDESPLMRLRAAKLACTAAEFFRDQGRDVLLMMDSITRFAHAQRQIGLSAGEPPATKGYTPSVFAQLALLLERAGVIDVPSTAAAKRGSITGLYTILVEGDDMTEPISDAVRGILDGHVILSRKLVQKAHYPAVDVLDSVSRVADDVTTEDHAVARRQIIRMLAAYRDVEDLVQIGAYAKGSNADADIAIEFNRRLNDMLRQDRGDATPFERARGQMQQLAKETAEGVQRILKSKGAR
ncbi:F-type H+-transporting ATPase subunit beta [Phycisphaerales bacterium]|nr:F-type H+-transporting ATPase subunit beta [Phycisphaerales bacterium]